MSFTCKSAVSSFRVSSQRFCWNKSTNSTRLPRCAQGWLKWCWGLSLSFSGSTTTCWSGSSGMKTLSSNTFSVKCCLSRVKLEQPARRRATCGWSKKQNRSCSQVYQEGSLSENLAGSRNLSQTFPAHCWINCLRSPRTWGLHPRFRTNHFRNSILVYAHIRFADQWVMDQIWGQELHRLLRTLLELGSRHVSADLKSVQHQRCRSWQELWNFSKAFKLCVQTNNFRTQPFGLFRGHWDFK